MSYLWQGYKFLEGFLNCGLVYFSQFLSMSVRYDSGTVAKRTRDPCIWPVCLPTFIISWCMMRVCTFQCGKNFFWDVSLFLLLMFTLCRASHHYSTRQFMVVTHTAVKFFLMIKLSCTLLTIRESRKYTW